MLAGLPITAPRRDVLRCGGLAVLALAYFGLLARFGLNVGEEGGTVYLIDRVVHGQRPYIDFISGYTPAYFYWHAWLLETFGSNLLVLRACVAMVNSASIVLLYLVARAVVPAHFAALPALGYMALLPVVPASECSFNVPYPAWYTLLFWLLGILVLQRVRVTEQRGWLLVAGILAGLSFSFKPNTGLFNLAADVLIVSLACPSRRVTGERQRIRVLRCAVPVVVLACVALVFRVHLWRREGLVFVAPLAVLVAAWLVRDGDSGEPRTRPAAFLAGVACLLAGFGLVTLPWLTFFCLQLGWSRFAHDVLFLNTGFEQFFYLAYRALAWRDVGLAAMAAGLAGAAYAARWRRAPVIQVVAFGVVGLAAAVVWLAWMAPMPEGFQRSVLLRVQDASFGAALLTHWAVLAVVGSPSLARLAGDTRADVQLILAAALCMFLNAYPRSDFYHVILSAPLTLVLGAVLLCWLTQRWRAVMPAPAARWVDVTVLVGVAALLAVVAAPQVGLCARVALHAVGHSAAGLERVALRRAPVLVRRGAAGLPVRTLVPVVDYLERERRDDDRLFTFPDLDVIGFLADLHTPARIGYFNPGWPAHAVEAEVVDTLAEQPPRFAVVANPAPLFFADAPAYYFLLREFVAARYRPWGRSGAYEVLLRTDTEAAPFHTAGADDTAGASSACANLPQPLLPDRLRACLATLPAAAWPGLIQQVRDSQSIDGAGVLSEMWAAGATERTPQSVALLALRVIGEVGDAAAAEALLGAAQTSDAAIDDAMATALFNIAVREMIEPFQFGAGPRRDGPAPRLWSRHRVLLRAWIDSPARDVRRRFFAAWALGTSGEHEVDASTEDDVATLAARAGSMLDDPNPALQLAAAGAVARLSSAPDTLPRLLRLLAVAPSFMPSFALLWSRAHPDAALPELQRQLAAGDPAAREMAAFLAGVLRWPTTLPQLQQAAAAPQPAVRLASIWALGNMARPAGLPTVRAAQMDPDAAVRRTATNALRRFADDDGPG